MKIDWRDLLTTPYPRTGWGLRIGEAVVLDEDRKEGVRCARAAVPAGTFEIGPVGLSSVETKALVPVLRSLQEEIGGCRRPSVVVPSSWVRLHLLDFDEVPKRSAELEEVVRWRLKKLLPIRPAELRIDAQPEKAPGGGWKVLSVSGVERAWEELEAAFLAAGMQPALMTPAIFALGEVESSAGADAMLLQTEPGMLVVVVRAGGTVGLVHTRLLPPADDAWTVVSRELRTIRLFLAERLGVEDSVDLLPMAMDPEGLEELCTACEAVDGIRVLTPPKPPSCDGLDGASDPLLTVVGAVVGRKPV
ncbi:MAG: hypothetical protein GXP47_05925 [Acidobacteria bacterium]|nr:hypothetical protein [Acidobacteriota bacterium]